MFLPACVDRRAARDSPRRRELAAPSIGLPVPEFHLPAVKISDDSSNRCVGPSVEATAAGNASPDAIPVIAFAVQPQPRFNSASCSSSSENE